MTNTPPPVILNLNDPPPTRRPKIDMSQVGCRVQTAELAQELDVLRRVELGGLCSRFRAELMVERSDGAGDISLLELTLVMEVPEVPSGRPVQLAQHETITPEELVKTGAAAWVRDCMLKYLTHEANEGLLLVHEPEGARVLPRIERPFDPHRPLPLDFISIRITLPRNIPDGGAR